MRCNGSVRLKVVSSSLLLKMLRQNIFVFVAFCLVCSVYFSNTALRSSTEVLPRECQATCVIGERRALNRRVWSSIVANSALLDCNELFVVISDSRPAQTEKYWTRNLTSMAANKNDVLEPGHRLKHDFAVTRESAVELKEFVLGNTVHLAERDSSVGWAAKQAECIDLVRAREIALGRNFHVIANVRSDTLYYNSVKRYVNISRLKRGEVFTIHYDMAWFGARDKLMKDYSRGQLIPKEDPHTLPIVLCRESSTLATYFNYLDTFLHFPLRSESEYRLLCFRLYLMFGHEIWNGNNRPSRLPDDFPVSQNFLQFRFREWMQRNSTSSAPQVCDEFSQVLLGAPTMKHDVEICTYWVASEEQRALKHRFVNQFSSLVAWLRVVESEVRSTQKVAVQVLVALCDIVRESRFLLVSIDVRNSLIKNTNPCQDSISLLNLTHRVTALYAHMRQYLDRQQLTFEEIDMLLQNKLTSVCCDVLPFDYYLWATHEMQLKQQ
jgi:hypothetical protein